MLVGSETSKLSEGFQDTFLSVVIWRLLFQQTWKFVQAVVISLIGKKATLLQRNFWLGSNLIRSTWIDSFYSNNMCLDFSYTKI